MAWSRQKTVVAFGALFILLALAAGIAVTMIFMPRQSSVKLLALPRNQVSIRVQFVSLNPALLASLKLPAPIQGTTFLSSDQLSPLILAANNSAADPIFSPSQIKVFDYMNTDAAWGTTYEYVSDVIATRTTGKDAHTAWRAKTDSVFGGVTVSVLPVVIDASSRMMSLQINAELTKLLKFDTKNLNGNPNLTVQVPRIAKRAVEAQFDIPKGESAVVAVPGADTDLAPAGQAMLMIVTPSIIQPSKP